MISAADIINECLASKTILEKGEGKSTQPIAEGSLSGKVVGLYFSAHWCPPCRRLTPVLAEKYKEIVAAGHQFEIIFVSADRKESEALEYFAEHPWKMLSFSNDEANNTLNDLFEVSGIPSLVLLDENFDLLTANGIEAVLTSDFERIKTFEADKIAHMSDASSIMNLCLADGHIVDHAATAVTADSVAGKIIGLYFSAHWCPPCRKLTPILGEKYKELVANGKPFEIFFVSSDRAAHEAEEYFSTHPWKMIKYDSREIKQELASKFDINGIPSLVLLDENFQLITLDGIEAVLSSDFDAIKSFKSRR